MKPPKGYESVESRKALAERLCTLIDSHDMAMESLRREWDTIQQVYDDKKTLSSLDFLEDIDPYNVALLQTRADSIVDHVCATIMASEPTFVFQSSGADDSTREQVESDVEYALHTAGFDRKTRDACLSAVLKGRGMMRLRYVTVEADHLHDQVDVTNLKLDSARYSGLVIDAFRPEDTVIFPLYAEDIPHASVVGHRFIQRLGDIQAKQEAGTYFDDVVLAPGDESEDSGSVGMEALEHGKVCYDIEARLIPPGGKRELRYRLTIAKTERLILAMEPYHLPRSSYFAPGLRHETNRFWPRKSIASKLIETQTIINDAVTLAVFGTTAEAFRNVVTSGGVQDTQTIRMGIGNLIHVRNPINIQGIDSRFNPGAISTLINLCQTTADSIAKISQAAMGQEFYKGTTATAAAGYLQGQQRGLSAMVGYFAEELVKMADFARYLLAVKYLEFVKCHGTQVQTRQPAAYLERFTIALNGQASSDPMSQVNKLQLLMNAARDLGIQIDSQALFETIMNALELPVSTNKILSKAPGVPNGLPPEQLLGLLAQLRPGMAPQRGLGAAPPGNPTPLLQPGSSEGPGGVIPPPGGVPGL